LSQCGIDDCPGLAQHVAQMLFEAESRIDFTTDDSQVKDCTSLLTAEISGTDASVSDSLRRAKVSFLYCPPIASTSPHNSVSVCAHDSTLAHARTARRSRSAPLSSG
jgi:hypothetical protein